MLIIGRARCWRCDSRHIQLILFIYLFNTTESRSNDRTCVRCVDKGLDALFAIGLGSQELEG